MAERKRAIGSLSHADFGQTIRIPGYGSGILWGIEHVAAFGDIPEPWTRVTLRRNSFSEGTRGLPPGTVVTFESAAREQLSEVPR